MEETQAAEHQRSGSLDDPLLRCRTATELVPTPAVSEAGECAPVGRCLLGGTVGQGEPGSLEHSATGPVRGVGAGDELDAFFDLADTIITLRTLIRRAWTHYRWEHRPHKRP